MTNKKEQQERWVERGGTILVRIIQYTGMNDTERDTNTHINTFRTVPLNCYDFVLFVDLSLCTVPCIVSVST